MTGSVLSGPQFAALRHLIGLSVPAAAAAALGVSREVIRSLDRGRFTGPQAEAICRDLLELVEQHDRLVDRAVDWVRRGSTLRVPRGDAVSLAMAARVLDMEPGALMEWGK